MARYEDIERNSGFKKSTIIEYLDGTITLCEQAKREVNSGDFDLDQFLRALGDIIRFPTKLRADIIANQAISDKYAKKK